MVQAAAAQAQEDTDNEFLGIKFGVAFGFVHHRAGFAARYASGGRGKSGARAGSTRPCPRPL